MSTYLIPQMIHRACFYFPKDISFWFREAMFIDNSSHVFKIECVKSKLSVLISDVKKVPFQTPYMVIFVILSHSQNTFMGLLVTYLLGNLL